MILEPLPRTFELQDEEDRFRTPDCPGSAAQSFATFSEIRFARIEALRSQIAAGAYRVPAADLAQKLIHCMLLPPEPWTSPG